MGGPRVLYVSSALGLGHVSKDLAIAHELRSLRPDIDVLWLTGKPASEILAAAGETVLPEATRWRGGTTIAEGALRDGQLDLITYIYRSLPAWAYNARLFHHVIADYGVDLVIGDETWEIVIPLNLRLLHPRIPFFMLFDFVGTEAVTGRLFDRVRSYLLNVVWSSDAKAFARGPYSEIFIGEIEDVPDAPFGRGLPNRREHARAHYVVVGHCVDFRPEQFADRGAVRRRLGYDDRPLVICSVGGTAIGRELLELCGRAYAPLADLLPGVHMVLVCGPRLPADSLTVPDDVDVRGYVPNLVEHHACCDVAIVQCGASSTTELAALGTPFIYFPIEGHFEQEFVAARLARHGAGKRMSLAETTGDDLARAVHEQYLDPRTSTPMPVDGARKAARHIAPALDARAA